jgi:hypothetical protein
MTITATKATKPKPQPADVVQMARPKLHQHAHEIQRYGQIVKLPIALSEKVCAVPSYPLRVGPTQRQWRLYARQIPSR